MTRRKTSLAATSTTSSEDTINVSEDWMPRLCREELKKQGHSLSDIFSLESGRGRSCCHVGRLSNRPEFSGTVPIFGAMSRIPNFHLIVPNFLREPVTEMGPPKKVTEYLQNFQSVAIHLKYLLLVYY